MWKSVRHPVCHPVCPTLSSSHFHPKSSVCPWKNCIYVWKSVCHPVCHPVCPTLSSSHFHPKSSVCPWKNCIYVWKSVCHPVCPTQLFLTLLPEKQHLSSVERTRQLLQLNSGDYVTRFTMSLSPSIIVLFLSLYWKKHHKKGTFPKKNSIPPHEREPDRVCYLLMVIMWCHIEQKLNFLTIHNAWWVRIESHYNSIYVVISSQWIHV